MKYRRLTPDELSELQKDFVQFLSANTITGTDWENLKANSPEKAEGLIDLFSDIVFETTLQKVKYLEFKTPKDIKTFHCQENKMVLLGLRITGEASIDFTKNADPQQMLTKIKGTNAELKLYQGEKKYQKKRELELFELMEKGALISKDGFLFKTLEQLRPNT